jgi:hypothetical protein
MKELLLFIKIILIFIHLFLLFLFFCPDKMYNGNYDGSLVSCTSYLKTCILYLVN